MWNENESLGRCDKSDPDKVNFRKKLRSSIEKDIEGVLDFAVIQVPYGVLYNSFRWRVVDSMWNLL